VVGATPVGAGTSALWESGQNCGRESLTIERVRGVLDVPSMLFITPGKAVGHLLEFKSFQWREQMNPGTKDEIAGRVHEVKGTIKEKVGELTNDPDLEGEGIGEKIAGKVRKKIGQVEKALGK
jgi:uncharacterized protein YjbJ (UPF0337 family)